MTVGEGARNGLRAEVASRAGSVFDNDGLAKLRRQFPRDQARQQIVSAAGREGHDQSDRLGREIGLRRGVRRSKQCGDGEERKTPARKLRSYPPGARAFGGAYRHHRPSATIVYTSSVVSQVNGSPCRKAVVRTGARQPPIPLANQRGPCVHPQSSISTRSRSGRVQ